MYQILDQFIFERKRHYVSAVEFEDKLMNIDSLGFKPKELNPAAMRGFIATFAINKGKLVLKKFWTNNGHNMEHEPPLINKKPPAIIVPRENGWQELTYKNINLPIPYDGSILITKDFINDCYGIHLGHNHLGVKTPFKWESVIKLTFKDGKYISYEDLSDIAKSIREKKIEPPVTDDEINYVKKLTNLNNCCFDVSFREKANELLKDDKI